MNMNVYYMKIKSEFKSRDDINENENGPDD